MSDRENVIKELKNIRDSIKTGQINGTYKMIVTINYAIDLLKEQEVVENLCHPSDDEPGVCRCAHESTTFNPHYIDEYGKHFICGVECGSCHEKISRTYHYCPYCGKALEWE